ncbi:MAG: hypothetical protein ACREID_06575 [Planctomycetota bacterium]
MRRRISLVACAALLAPAWAEAMPKSGNFEVRHEVKVSVPEGAKRLRL